MPGEFHIPRRLTPLELDWLRAGRTSGYIPLVETDVLSGIAVICYFFLFDANKMTLSY